MSKSATDVMQEIIFAAVVDSLDALKSASKGLPNNLLRDINAIHTNSTFADLPKELQATITASVRGAFNRLLKEGYSVAPGNAPPPRSAPGNRPPSGDRRPPAGGSRPPPGERRPPRPGQRPNRNPRPPRPK
ncbi:MAG TPA: hypothetical protein VK391_05435 [Allosphingosinicella sp.]|jgi:hypothetical protein|nr:hypothetical protein [Allosphingosinicella sp.]